MRLGTMVTTWKQNELQANGKLLILKNQRRPDRFDHMLRSCWLVFLCKWNCAQWICSSWTNCESAIFLKVLKRLRDSVRKKTTRNVEQRWLVPSPRQCPCPHGLECAAVFGKTTWRLSLILPIHPTLRHATFSCSIVWKARSEGKRFADVSEVKKKTLEVLNNISPVGVCGSE